MSPRLIKIAERAPLDQLNCQKGTSRIVKKPPSGCNNYLSSMGGVCLYNGRAQYKYMNVCPGPQELYSATEQESK